MGYTASNITGANSPTIGNDKDTYTADFDAAMAALDAHDHSSGKGLQVSTAGVADLAITTIKLAAQAVDASKLATSVAGAGLAGGGGTALSVNVDGSTLEITTDTLNVKAGGITATQLAASVAGAGLAGGAGTALSVNVDNSTLEITTDTLNVKALGVGTAQLAALSVTTAKIAAAAVTETQLAASVAGAGLAGGAGTALSVNVDNSTLEITTDTLNVKAGGIAASHLATDSVTTTKILALNVTGAKIAAATITGDKMAALGHSLSSSCGSFTTSSTTNVDVTNLTVTGFISTGRPVIIELVSDGTGSVAYVDANFNGLNLDILRDGVVIASLLAASNGNLEVQWPASAIRHFDPVGAGTYAYKVQVRTPTGGTIKVFNCKLLVRELK